ncbi:PAS domain S-box protein [Desulfovibrio sulfodismutans]|uniref:histidine kinase n=1 Tax=Desulfolutivibrio sulfodismutans TaxID=63561 RepID=A0A7K3NGJ8_9BACT|nr:PAS domain S-box protein [Desulfolutivibrio sulfodismutans]NDY55310.1 PAS domain S-box protein [Desulfolutivibrio sulfodismutans]QLA11012.1 PAS domain S-box protein [Desulfolutivibrio sulfodismutans DSM 3696]
MKPPADSAPDWNASREKLIGLGEGSLSKSYYPELSERLAELERFRELLDQSNDAIFLVDADSGRILDAAGSAPSLLGRDKGRIIGAAFSDFLRPKAAARVAAVLAAQGTDAPLATDMASPDGALVPVEMTIRVAQSPTQRKAVVVARDISERKKAERALRRAEDRYRSIVENAVEGFFTSTPAGRFTSANPAMATLLGYGTPERLLAEVTDIRSQIYADTGDRDRLIQLLKARGGATNFPARFRHKSGRTIWVSLNIRVERDASGLPLFLEGSCEDITARKMAEDALRDAHALLEKRVEERTRELHQANERLMREVQERRRAEEAAEAANRTKSDFLSMVSHEIRTPLTSILGFSKIIQRKLKQIFENLEVPDPRLNKATGQVSGNLDIIISEGERLTNLINDVLDLAKLESGRMEFTMEAIDPSELISRVMASTSVLLEGKDVRMVRCLDEGLPSIQGDRDRIIQVLVNLISNAVKFTDHGTIGLCAVSQDEFLRISVSDTGIGIHKKDFEKIFEKFNQVRGGITDRPKGTGLGLPICKHIVESHGGRIWFESTPGKGSIFTFTLPLPG